MTVRPKKSSLPAQYDDELQELVRGAHHNGRAAFLMQTLYSSGQPLATLALRGALVPQITFDAIASLTLSTLERCRSFENESRAEGERQTEQLRAAVLDALAHDFKSPLTTIRTASTAILTMRQVGELEEKLVSLIDTESRKLDSLTTQLLQTSRLDSTEVRLHLDLTDAADVIQETVAMLSDQLRGHPVRTYGLENKVELLMDRDLMVTALAQIVDNAAKYSTPGSTISIYLEVLKEGTRIAIHNFGPLIPSDQLERIFERFYRSPRLERYSVGTGLGLSVTKKIIEAHGGTVGVQSGVGGTTFYVSLRQETNQPAIKPQANGKALASFA